MLNDADEVLRIKWRRVLGWVAGPEETLPAERCVAILTMPCDRCGRSADDCPRWTSTAALQPARAVDSHLDATAEDFESLFTQARRSAPLSLPAGQMPWEALVEVIVHEAFAPPG